MDQPLDGFGSKAERLAYLEQLLSGRLPAEPADQRLLTCLMNPAVRGPFLDTLLLQSQPAIRAFVQRLVAGGDERAVAVLVPLLHSADEPVVHLAIEALGRLGSARARPALVERLNFDPRAEVRRAAAEALARLPEGEGTAAEEAQLPLHAAYLTVVDGAGGQMALVARRWDADELASFHVIFDDTRGVVESFGFASEPASEFVDTLDDLEDDGLTPVAVPLAEIQTAIADAYQKALEQRGRVSVTFVAWRSFLAGDDPREIPPVQLPAVDLQTDFEVFAECHRLLDLDEFGTWYFEPAEISGAIDRLRKLQRRRGEPDYVGRVVGLVRQTLNQLFTPDRRQQFQQRLERQAPLLLRLYDDPIHARRALAAAAGLAEEAGMPVSEHPLLQEMLVRSLEEALGRPLIDEQEA